MPEPMGRPPKYKPEYCDMLVEHMSEGSSMLSFAAEIDVARSTLNEWADKYPEFSEAVSRGKAKCAAWWETVGRKLAVTGEGNATMVVFGLTNMARDEWRNKQEIDHQSSDGSMTPQPSTINANMPPQEAAEAYAATIGSNKG